MHGAELGLCSLLTTPTYPLKYSGECVLQVFFLFFLLFFVFYFIYFFCLYFVVVCLFVFNILL